MTVGRRKNAIIAGSVSFVMIAFVVAACGDDDGSTAPEDPAGSCAILASQCHPYGKVSQLGKECHDLGHDGDDSQCIKRKKECLAACPIIEGGADGHDSGTDAGSSNAEDASTSDSEAGPPEDAGDFCAPYCQCMMDTCSTTTGYPFATIDACLSQCATMQTEERDCWPKFCEQAKSLANKTHVCEHAWGKFGLDECEQF